MTKTMVIDGVVYDLVPRDEEKDLIDLYTEPEKALESNTEPISEPEEKPVVKPKTKPSGITRAVPKPYGYAERLKDKKLKPSDYMVVDKRTARVPDLNVDPGNNISKAAGYNVWVGEGTTLDF